MNKILIRCIAFVFIFQACKNSSESNTEVPLKKIEARYDLFAEENEVYQNQKTLTIEESFFNSKEVIRVDYLEEVEYVTQRNNRPFYIYKITHGQSEKTEDTIMLTYPLFFLSEAKLFQGKIFTDSTYIFLTTPERYDVLKVNASINYKWTKDAPLISN